MSSQTAPQKRVTIHELRRMKASGERIAVVTAYDSTSARLVDRGGQLGTPDDAHLEPTAEQVLEALQHVEVGGKVLRFRDDSEAGRA